jgi:hypothetical protein
MLLVAPAVPHVPPIVIATGVAGLTTEAAHALMTTALTTSTNSLARVVAALGVQVAFAPALLEMPQ